MTPRDASDPPADPTAFVRSAMPLCDAFAIDAVELGPTRVELSMPFDRRFCTSGDALHGGAVMALADSAGALLAHLALPEDGIATTTTASTTHFVAAARTGPFTAVATPIHSGRTTTTVRVEVADADGRLVAHTTQTQLVLR